MKRKMLLFFCALVCVFCGALAFAACGDDTGNSGSGGNGGNGGNTEQGANQGGNEQKPDDGKGEETVIKVEKVSLNKNLLTLEIGDTYTLTETVLPATATDKSVIWSSSDISKVTVNGGKVKAVAEGEAIITVKTTDGNKTASCNITVIKSIITVESISLNESSLILGYGEEATLFATILPEDATNQNIVWSSSDNGVVTVQAGKITAVDIGTATIVVVTVDGKKTAECNITVKGLKYAESIVGGKVVAYSVIGVGTVTDKDLVIPETHNEKAVTAIEKDAFKNCSFIESIEIPDTVTSVENAFSGCNNLIRAKIPASAITYIPKSKLVEVNVTSGIKILPYAFKNCISIENINIADSIIFIGNEAFAGCINLSNVSLSNEIKAMGRSVFEGCEKLKFNEYNNAYYLGNNINKYVLLFKAKNKEIINCSVYTKSKAIYDSAFRGCSALTSISIPDSITSVGKNAFSGCDKLKYNELDNAKYLGNENNPYAVFMRTINTQYIDIRISENTKAFYNGALSGCSYAKTFTIPKGITNFSQEMFSGCDRLKEINIPDSVIYIGDLAFRDCYSIKNIELPVHVIEIGGGLFYKCTDLESVKLNNNISSLTTFDTMGMFEDCLSLKNINISENVSSIGYDTFKNCNQLIIEIEKGVKYLDKWVIGFGSSVTEVTLRSDTKGIADGAFGDCSSLTSITIPNSVTRIGMGAFSGCSSLTSITIPDSLTSIDNRAFEQCGSLTSVSLPDGVTNIGYAAFRGCSSLTSITIPDSVTSIGYAAFSGCSSLTSITIPDSVTSIGDSAFVGCDLLAIIRYKGDIKSWCKVKGLGYLMKYGTKDRKLLIDNVEIKDILVIPNGVTNIDASTFRGCGSLTGVIIPDSVTSIGNNAFAYCSSLTSVTIPDSVTTIGNYAFA